MPGLFALISCGRLLQDATLPSAARWPLYKARELHREDTALLGAFLRHRGSEHVSFHSTGEYILTLYGHCADPRIGHHLQAEELLAALQREGDGVLDRLEGDFYALEIDRTRSRVRLFNDRIGTLAVYWHYHDGILAVAPRLGMLPATARQAGVNPGAAIMFLSIGHYLGPNTLLQEANFLTPATIISLDLQTGRLTQKRYWNLVYNPDTDASPATLCRRLGESIQEATSLLTQPEAGRGGIFLSGGWDSRALLGAALAVGRPPALVVTNGMSDEIPGADTFLARRLAGDLDLPYKFCRRVPDIGPAAWLDGLHKGEITTANNPENFGQHGLDADFFGDLEFMLKGDVTWGSGAPALSREQSINKVVPFPLAEGVKAVLVQDLRGKSDALYYDQIDSVMRHCENDDWTDRRDYLWQMGGINRYILGLGISDEEHTQVRRPMLSGIVLRHYTSVPRRLRCNKNLFIESIRRFYPELFAYGRNHVSNIAHYYHYMAPFVRERTLAHLTVGHNLDGLLDRDVCRAIVEAFNPTKEEILQLRWHQRVKNHLHDRLSYRWHRCSWYREKHAKQFITTPTMLAFHIYLLLEWYHGEIE